MKVVASDHPLGIPPDRYDVEKDGVNASLLGRWINCREMARLHLLGWTSKRIGAGRIFGTLVHGVQDNVYSDMQSGALDGLPTKKRIKKELALQEEKWRKLNPRADAATLETLELNLMLAEAIMPVYFQFWHRDVQRMDWIALEHSFKVPIGPTGIKLVGRMDGNFHPFKGKKVAWLFETKTKSRMGEHGESNLVDILPFELQTNLYLGAMAVLYKQQPAGLVLNIVRRPAFKGKKGESLPELYQRIAADVQKRPEYYFVRLRMSVDKPDLVRVQKEHIALVEDFSRWAKGKGAHFRNSDHCENKYGTCEFLRVCSRGDYGGLYQRKPRIRKEEDAV